jgi:hypothetical protein
MIAQQALMSGFICVEAIKLPFGVLYTNYAGVKNDFCASLTSAGHS